MGVTATDDVDALLALQPDCVLYNPMWHDTSQVVQILEAGINVVTTAGFINGLRLGADRDRIAEACGRGESSILGTGISPGLVELIGITVAGLCDRIDKITIDEASDTTLYDSPDTERPAGFGRPIDDPELPKMAEQGTAVFGEAVALMADALGVELDEIVCEPEYAETTEDLVMDSWTIPAGCVAGVAASWQGRRGGRTVVELNVRWNVIQVDGRPTVRAKLDYLPPPDFEATTFADFMVLGMIMTAMPAVNAIPVVIAAPPGIVTYADVPVPLPRGWVPS
jgi:4-hydroxy-tetrahydrodipicolinate reductase